MNQASRLVRQEPGNQPGHQPGLQPGLQQSTPPPRPGVADPDEYRRKAEELERDPDNQRETGTSWREENRQLAVKHRQNARDLDDPPQTSHRWQEKKTTTGNQTLPMLHCRLCDQDMMVGTGTTPEQARNHPGKRPCATVHLRTAIPPPGRDNPRLQGIREHAPARCGYQRRWKRSRESRRLHLIQENIHQPSKWSYPLVTVNCADCLETPATAPDPVRIESGKANRIAALARKLTSCFLRHFLRRNREKRAGNTAASGISHPAA